MNDSLRHMPFSLHGSHQLTLYLVIHNGTEAHDADMYIILLAHQSGVFQRFFSWQCIVAAIG